ncbi:MAG: hypothetical protein WAN89_07300 [Lawsonella sp.]
MGSAIQFVLLIVFLALGIAASIVIVRQYPSGQGKFTDVAFAAFITLVVMMLLFLTVNYFVLLGQVV